jgi:multidrug efflux pump subunit AcrA (membrane-fusion protein)
MIRKHRKIIIPIGIIAVLGAIFWIWGGNKTTDPNVTVCGKGVFETTVASVGEIEAVKTVDILVPDAMSNNDIRIYQLKIIDMVAEGTKVRAGDYVATLDPGDVESELKRAVENLEQQQNKKAEARIDSSLQLTALRSDIRNANDQMLDKQLKIDQSKYESKAYQRQVQIDYDKASRNYEQKKRNYQKEHRRQEIRIERISDDIAFYEKRRDLLLSLKNGLRVKAPVEGMVVYGKSWWGGKIKVGDQVGRYSPLIATLPDLSVMVSVAYVQEIDIKYVAVGQKVRLSVDAFPDKKFTGTITFVANVGQRIPGKDMNGFKVNIRLDAFTEAVLPGMTTNNTIVTGSWNDALMVSREAVFGNDSLQFVYLKNGLSVHKQQIITGGENETSFRIVKGLSKGDKVLLKHPDDAAKLELKRL